MDRGKTQVKFKIIVLSIFLSFFLKFCRLLLSLTAVLEDDCFKNERKEFSDIFLRLIGHRIDLLCEFSNSKAITENTSSGVDEHKANMINNIRMLAESAVVCLKRLSLPDQLLTSFLTRITSGVLINVINNFYWNDFLEASFDLIIQINELFFSKISIWKKEVLDIFMDKNFFKMRNSFLEKWRRILPTVISLDTFKTFTEGLIGSQSSSFLPFKDQNINEKTSLWKRISFSMLVCPKDTFRYNLPDLQKALVESFKSFSDELHAESFLFLRVLLIKMSPKYTSHFWAVILSAMVMFNLLNIDYKFFKRSSRRFWIFKILIRVL